MQRAIGALLMAMLAAGAGWAARVLPWHQGPSLGWPLWLVASVAAWTCGSLLTAASPGVALRWLSRASLTAALIIVTGTGWGAASLAKSHGGLGLGLGTVAVVIAVLIAATLGTFAWLASELHRADLGAPWVSLSAPGDAARASAVLARSAALCGLPLLVLWPITWASGEDSFPLSSYPMFAQHRGHPSFAVLLGWPSGVARPRLLPARVAAGGELLQAKAVLGRLSQASPEALTNWCDGMRVRSKSDPLLRGLDSLELQVRSYDVLEYFENGHEPLSQRTAFRCVLSPPELPIGS